MTLSLVIPFHNEISQLDHTLRQLKKLKKEIKEIDLIFIDDFSTDTSYEYLKKITKNEKKIQIIQNKKKGISYAIQEGIKKSRSKFICIFMCDMSDDIKDVVKYYKTIKSKKVDVVFGSRFVSKSKVKNYPLFKLIINRIANNIIKLIFFSDYNDFTNAFKIYNRKCLLNLFPLVSESFNLFLELSLKIITRDYKYHIIPVNWTERKKGKSKFKINELGSKYLFILLYCLLEKILLKKKK